MYMYFGIGNTGILSNFKSLQYFYLIVVQVETPLEMKLNVTDTELVVVENAAAWDTNAVILKVRTNS